MTTKEMIKEAKKKETIGKLILDDNGEILEYEPGWLGQGYGYKNFKAYFEDKSAVCYIPESDELNEDMYTGQNFLDLCNDQPEIADLVFLEVDWQHPETYINQAWEDDELSTCTCGKHFWTHDADATHCPYCGRNIPDKDEYIRLHRILWNRIEDINASGEKAVKAVIVYEMFKEGLSKVDGLIEDCFLCEYAHLAQIRDKENHGYSRCDCCPLKWGESDDSDCCEAYNEDQCYQLGLYGEWKNANHIFHNYVEAATLARQIADLPEKES